MDTLTAIFKALSDPLRLRIVDVLLRSGHEAYGEELARTLRIPPYRLSRHLKVLKATGLIHERRVGRWVYYSLGKRNGHEQLLRLLRRLIGNAKGSPTNGRVRALLASASKRRRVGRSSREAAMESETFNWNEGPAIPGIL